MIVIFDGGGHVTITTMNIDNRNAWADTKKDYVKPEEEGELKMGLLGQLKAYYLTKKVASSRVGEEMVAKPK